MLTREHLLRFGFSPDTELGEPADSYVFRNLRVSLHGAAGVCLHAFEETERWRGEEARKHGLCAWRVHFDDAVPAAVTLATIRQVVNL